MVYEGTHRLGDFFKSRREKGKAGLPTVSVTLNDGLADRDSMGRKMETSLTDDEHLLVKKGDIVYNMMRMWQGASGLSDKDGLVSPAYVVLAPRKNIDSKYAAYLFKSQRFIYLCWAYSYGLTSDRLRLYFADFARIPVIIPDVSEQAKIAKILVTWDKAIEVTEKLIATGRAQKKALMKMLLTGQKRMPGFADSWRTVSIRSMGRVVAGGTPDTAIDSYWEGKILWATPTDISGLESRYIDDSKRKLTESGVKASAATVLPVGTILVCTRATVGEAAISKREITTNQGFKSLIPKPEFDSDFVYYLFQQFKHEFVRYACGSTFLELSKKDFERRRFLVPELNEQKRIVKVLNAASLEIQDLVSFRAKLSREKHALMQQLLTGRRRVKLDGVV